MASGGITISATTLELDGVATDVQKTSNQFDVFSISHARVEADFTQSSATRVDLVLETSKDPMSTAAADSRWIQARTAGSGTAVTTMRKRTDRSAVTGSDTLMVNYNLSGARKARIKIVSDGDANDTAIVDVTLEYD